MTDSDRRGKKRPTVVEGFNNVPNILEEARRAVDEVTQAGPSQGAGKETPAAPASKSRRPQDAPRKKPAPASPQPKNTPRPAASRVKPAAAAPSPAVESAVEPRRGLAYFGITVKHALPGRIRLRLPQMLHNDSLASKLPARLAAVPGVVGAEASTATGSLLLTFNPRELATAQGRRKLAGVLHQFFPGLDLEILMQRLLLR
jgi:hypothetical protein